MCCGSSLTDDQPSAVWPAGFAACVYVCCGSSLTSDLPSAVWSDLPAVVNFLSVTFVGLVVPIVSCHHLFMELPFNIHVRVMYMYKSSMHFLHPFAGTPSQNFIKGAKKLISSRRNLY